MDAFRSMVQLTSLAIYMVSPSFLKLESLLSGVSIADLQLPLN